MSYSIQGAPDEVTNSHFLVGRIVERVVLLGAPLPLDTESWMAVRKVSMYDTPANNPS